MPKKKGDSRGISLLSVAGKILARVMLKRLLNHVVDIVMGPTVVSAEGAAKLI